MLVMQAVGKHLRLGSETHSGWLPGGSATPRRTPIRRAVVDVKIEFDGHGFLLVCESRNTEDSWDTWHAALNDAVQAAREQLGIEPDEWRVESRPEVIRLLVEEELATAQTFENSHGISRDNVKNHLLEPAMQTMRDVSPGRALSLWVALEEHRGQEGYLVGFDPEAQRWSLAYREADGVVVLVSHADAFLTALEAM